MQDSEVAHRLKEIALDRISGAREILGRLLHLLTGSIRPGDDAGALEAVLEVARTVVPFQPTMAPLLSSLDRLFHALEARGAAGVQEELDAQVLDHRHGLAKVGARALPELTDVTSLATLSWSSTVSYVLERLPSPLEVRIAESRPGGEGRRAAARTVAMGHRVRFYADAAFPLAAAGVETLLLGADALTPQGLVNKVGSRAAARECRAAGTKVIVLMDHTKVVGEELADRLRILSETPDELWDAAPHGIEVQNRHFELVPLDLLDAVLGIEGARTAAEALSAAARRTPSAYWKDVPLPALGVPLMEP